MRFHAVVRMVLEEPGCEWLLCHAPFGLNLKGSWAFRGHEQQDQPRFKLVAEQVPEGDPRDLPLPWVSKSSVFSFFDNLLYLDFLLVKFTLA